MRKSGLFGLVPIAFAILGLADEAALLASRHDSTVAGRPTQAGALAAPGVHDIRPDGSRPALGHPRRTRELVKQTLMEAAGRHHVDPNLVLALSYWESAWDQSKVSTSGAIGVMQIEPEVAAEAGPELLGRPVDLTDLWDNADVGAAILRQDLDAFGDPAQALAAYYQGASSLRASGPYPDTQQYVGGILALAARIRQGQGPR
jgi:soluble lytic murein transglycosylase-like protein